MENTSMLKSLIRSNKTIKFALSFFIIFGLISKFLESIDLTFNSDTIINGLVSMELIKHQNLLLSNFYVSSSNTILFTEIIPFDLIPQIVTNYNPYSLRIMHFIIFISIVFIFSYILYLITNNDIVPLLFASLLLNIPGGSYISYVSPAIHDGTILFSGVLIALLCDIYIFNKYNDIKLCLLILITSLVAFSDSLIYAIFIVPFILYYLLFMQSKNQRLTIAYLAVLLLSGLVYVIKSKFIPTFINMDIHIVPIDVIIRNYMLYIQGILLVLNYDLYEFVQNLNFFIYVDVILFIALIAFAIIFSYTSMNDFEDSKLKNLILFLIMANLVLFIGYTCTTLAINVGTSRYLVFSVISIFMFLSILYLKQRNICMIVFAILSVCLVSNCISVMNLDYHPNNEQYDLINFLSSNNLTYGYGDYWDSNIITYLSGETIKIRPIEYTNEHILPLLWFSSEKWYDPVPENFFIIVDKSNTDDSSKMYQLSNKYHPLKVYDYKNYEIYTYEHANDILQK